MPSPYVVHVLHPRLGECSMRVNAINPQHAIAIVRSQYKLPRGAVVQRVVHCKPQPQPPPGYVAASRFAPWLRALVGPAATKRWLQAPPKHVPATLYHSLWYAYFLLRIGQLLVPRTPPRTGVHGMLLTAGWACMGYTPRSVGAGIAPTYWWLPPYLVGTPLASYPLAWLSTAVAAGVHKSHVAGYTAYPMAIRLPRTYRGVLHG